MALSICYSGANAAGGAKQLGDSTAQTTAGPARPKLTHDGTVRLKSNNGVRYSLYYYFQHGGGFSNLESHVFYAPRYHLVVDADGMIKHHFDENVNFLTLWVRYPNSFEEIEGELRNQLAMVAKEKHDVEVLQGTNPYRITELTITTSFFELTQSKLKSDEFAGGLIEGDIPIYFRNLTMNEAGAVIHDLDKNITQLQLRYTFSAISDEKCTATYSGEGVQEVSLYKELEGEGRERVVSRRQAANIADSLVKQESFEFSCAEVPMLSDLADLLLKRLESREQEVAGWDELSEFVTLDRNDFGADVTTRLKEVDNEVASDRFAAAMSAASSKAQEDKFGAKLSTDVMNIVEGELETNFEGANSEAKTVAKKAIKDTLAKSGVSIEWDGWKSIPKTVDLHTIDELDAKWEHGVEFEYSIPQGQEGGGTYRLGIDHRTASIPRDSLGELDYRLGEVDKKISDLDELWQSIEARHLLFDVVRVDGDTESFSLRSERLDDQTTDQRGILSLHPGGVQMESFDGVDGDDNAVRSRALFGNGDLDVRVSDDVDIKSDDDVYVEADDRIIIESRRQVQEERRRRQSRRAGVSITSENGAPIVIDAGDGYVIINAEGLIINGREVPQ